MNRKMKQQEGLGPSEWTRLVMKVGWPVDFGLHGWVAEEAGTVVCLDQRTWCVSFMGWTWGGNCQMRGKRVRFVTSDSELTHAPTPSCTWNRNTYWDRLNLWKRGVGSRPKGWKSREKTNQDYWHKKRFGDRGLVETGKRERERVSRKHYKRFWGL